MARPRTYLAAAGGVAIGLFVVLAAYDWARLATLHDARTLGNQRLRLYAVTIRQAIDRFSHLPTILSMDPEIRRMLVRPRPESVSAANVRLEKINAAARSANLYVMNPLGDTVAASNWNTSDSYVGNNYGFRPYFQDARDRGAGSFFGVGLTTRKPGYFLASGMRDSDGHFLGAAVVKIDLEGLERDWALAGERVQVTDHNGVAILSSVADWRYTVESPLDEGLRSRLAMAQRYGEQDIRQLAIVEEAVLDEHTRIVSIGGHRFMSQRQQVPGENWEIQYFTDWDAASQGARGTGLVAGSVWVAVLLLLLYLRQRRQGIRARADAQAAVEETLRRARDELERTVTTRTAALRAEVAERQKTERHLRETQEELIHAGKMAALGQMSAAMAHEINQPLTALRTFLSSTRIFVEMGDHATVADNFTTMESLAERIAKITQHLKVFARKSPISFLTIDLSQSIKRALVLLDGQLRSAGVEVVAELAPAMVSGDPLRLEQVFVNLIRNAMDAMQDSPVKSLKIAVRFEADTCCTRIADTGGGIAPEDMERLFEPFFTTKDVGKGLGLGLSLSYGIIRDMGGTIHAENLAPTGAVFIIRLPLTTSNEGRDCSD